MTTTTTNGTGRRISVHDATLKTATVEIKSLVISGKQMTLAVFRQLIEAPLIDSETGEFRGLPWGAVNYHPDGCKEGREHLHVIWQSGGELRRAAVRPTDWERPVAVLHSRERDVIDLWARAAAWWETPSRRDVSAYTEPARWALRFAEREVTPSGDVATAIERLRAERRVQSGDAEAAYRAATGAEPPDYATESYKPAGAAAYSKYDSTWGAAARWMSERGERGYEFEARSSDPERLHVRGPRTPEVTDRLQGFVDAVPGMVSALLAQRDRRVAEVRSAFGAATERAAAALGVEHPLAQGAPGRIWDRVERLRLEQLRVQAAYERRWQELSALPQLFIAV